jgi:hypothetical protein
MPSLSDLRPYDLAAARRRLSALELEIAAGNAGGVARALARQLRKEIAAAEGGLHPSVAARPSRVPAVKAAARVGRSVDEPVDGAGARPAVAGPTEAEREAEIEARVIERLKVERQRRRMAARVAKKVAAAGRRKAAKPTAAD